MDEASTPEAPDLLDPNLPPELRPQSRDNIDKAGLEKIGSVMYQTPVGGLPPQTELLSSRAIFTNAYAVIPRKVLTEIVVSRFPGWNGTKGWVLARPLSGFAETFSQMILDVAPGGGSNHPEPDRTAGAVLFVLSGHGSLMINGEEHVMRPGIYAYLPPNCDWQVRNTEPEGGRTLTFHWIRKAYEPVDGLEPPEPFVIHEADAEEVAMRETQGVWTTTRFVDPEDMRHDFHVNIVNFQPGGVIAFSETHVMEHGIYVLEGKGVYRLNHQWVEVQAGDFMWLRAFCPQACYAGGPGRFRYLLYKDVNRFPKLKPFG